MRDLDLANRLRREGLKVIEVDGWESRGKEAFSPRGSVNHHTAGPLKGNAPSLGVVINGRPDVPGPLCHVLLARDLTAYVVASGRANHAGKGGWRGLVGNSSVYGVEVENTGLANEPATPALLDAMYRVHAAFLRGIDHPNVELVCQHEEWAPLRKIDFHDLAFEPFRQGVARRLAGAPPVIPPKPIPSPAEQEEQELLTAASQIIEAQKAAIHAALPIVVKASTADKAAGIAKGENFVLSGQGRYSIGTGPEAGRLLEVLGYAGQIQYPKDGKPSELPAADFRRLPLLPKPFAFT